MTPVWHFPEIGVRIEPRLGSDTPLFASKHLAESYEQGVRQIYTILYRTPEIYESTGYASPDLLGTGSMRHPVPGEEILRR